MSSPPLKKSRPLTPPIAVAVWTALALPVAAWVGSGSALLSRLSPGCLILCLAGSGALWFGLRAYRRELCDRERVEEELAVAAALLNGASDALIVVDRCGRIVEANEAAWRSRGFTREELLAMSVYDLNCAGRASEVTARLARVFAEGTLCFEAEHRLKEGGCILVEVNSRAIVYRGEPAQLSCIRNITKRKRTEESLRRAERYNGSLQRIAAFLGSLSDEDSYRELLTTLLEVMGSPVGMAGYLDESGALVCPSPKGGGFVDDRPVPACTVFTADSWGESLWGGVLTFGRAAYANTLQVVPAGHAAIYRCLAAPLTCQGRTIGLLMVANADRDYDDEDLQMLCAVAAQVAPVLQARLDRTRAAAALMANENKLRVIFDVIQAGIIQVDGTGAITFANQRMAEMFGLELSELVGSRYRDHVHPEQLASADLSLCRLMEGELDSVHIERHFLRRDGSDFWGYLTGQRLPVANGGEIVLVGTVADMSELKAAEEKRHKSEQQMLHVQKLESLGVLAGGIAHDFNNILLAIMGNASLALHLVDPGSGIDRHLQQIEQAAGKAADLAGQMLAYSGKGRFLLQTLDLNELVRDLGGMLEVSVAKKVELRFYLAEELPAIYADATQIRQIVMNLAINASEAIGECSGAISIATGIRYCDLNYLGDTWLNDQLPEGRYVFIEVADTGCGMERETVERIFEPFFTTKFTGRGLGMAAILGIVRGHSGAIKVYTEPGRGSSFRVYIPASEQPADPKESAASVGEWQGAGTVLLVDDEASVRSTTGDMLRVLGFTVVTAADGREALQQYRLVKDEVSLVLMDLNMPRVSGEEAFRELRRMDAGVRVVLSSGFSEQEVSRKFLGQGLAGFIQKPYTLSTLRDTLSRLS